MAVAPSRHVILRMFFSDQKHKPSSSSRLVNIVFSISGSCSQLQAEVFITPEQVRHRRQAQIPEKNQSTTMADEVLVQKIRSLTRRSNILRRKLTSRKHKDPLKPKHPIFASWFMLTRGELLSVAKKNKKTYMEAMEEYKRMKRP
ncbi:hypothetical protein YC2023_041778 [Brassica napus]